MNTISTYSNGTQELRISQYSDRINVSIVKNTDGVDIITFINTSQTDTKYESTTVTQIVDKNDTIALIKLLASTL